MSGFKAGAALPRIGIVIHFGQTGGRCHRIFAFRSGIQRSRGRYYTALERTVALNGNGEALYHFLTIGVLFHIFRVGEVPNGGQSGGIAFVRTAVFSAGGRYVNMVGRIGRQIFYHRIRLLARYFLPCIGRGVGGRLIEYIHRRKGFVVVVAPRYAQGGVGGERIYTAHGRGGFAQLTLFDIDGIDGLIGGAERTAVTNTHNFAFQTGLVDGGFERIKALRIALRYVFVRINGGGGPLAIGNGIFYAHRVAGSIVDMAYHPFFYRGRRAHVKGGQNSVFIAHKSRRNGIKPNGGRESIQRSGHMAIFARFTNAKGTTFERIGKGESARPTKRHGAESSLEGLFVGRRNIRTGVGFFGKVYYARQRRIGRSNGKV